MSRNRHLKTYSTLGALLSDYRDKFGIKQAALAAEIAVDTKTLSRWENQNNPGQENLLRLAQRTLFPFELLVRLAHGIPTLYNVTSHRMAYSTFDTDFINKKLLREELFDAAADVEITHAIDSLDDVLKQKAVNLVSRGYHGTYVGHLFTLPLKKTAYSAMRARQRHEGDVASADLVSTDSANLGALHIYSFHASTSHVAYAILQHLVLALMRDWKHLVERDCSLTRYPVTEDGLELSIKMGLGQVFTDPREHTRFKTEIIPEFREGRFGSEELKWIIDLSRRVRL
jgi:transcriptional regulator with XRE-family HTH domain